jgi:hypothetical protein
MARTLYPEDVEVNALSDHLSEILMSAGRNDPFPRLAFSLPHGVFLNGL